MPDRIALYPGSFDPPTNGHLDLIERATKMFENVIVAVARNNEKKCLFSVDDRVEMLCEITGHLSKVTVTSFAGLTARFAEEQGAVAIVRGLRAISDYEFELSMAITNQKLNPETDTVLLMPSEPYLFLSSRVVKEIASFDGDISSFVPPSVEARLRGRLARQ